MKMTGLQIFKYMPAGKKTQHANCKECGCATCMMFSLKLAKEQIEIDKCPYIDDELREIYSQGLKHPQKTIEIEDLKIGGENVLYRHEKTFINPTTLAVFVDCSKPDYKEKIKQITDFELHHASENIKVDLIILKNSDSKIEYSTTKIITYEEYKKLGLNIIKESDFKETSKYLLETRIKAIKEKDDKFSAPVCVEMKNDDLYSLCTHSSYYICKYANMLVFEDFNEELFSTIMMLRFNIFTDPQKVFQVEAGLYKFNEPDKNSIVFMTTNFALTYFAVANELRSLDIPSYLIVVPAQGMSVLTAWSAQALTSDVVMKALNDFNIKEEINTRKIIISGLLSELKEELNEQCNDFEFVEGTKDASDIGEFVKNYLPL